ncbi:MAG: hypothetical protein COB09_17030 [Thalassobium sp.]|nr:MAG: hypothetical protein COB09_17030 [Thalassobium sp.]
MTSLHDENEHGRKALRLAAMLGHFPQQEQNAAINEVIADDYMSAVKHLPAYAVDAGVRSLLLSGPKRRPTMKMVVDACSVKALRYTELKVYIKKVAAHWGEL